MRNTLPRLFATTAIGVTLLAPATAVSAVILDYDPAATGPAIESITLSTKTLTAGNQFDLTDDDVSTGPTVGRFIVFDLTTTLNAPVSGEFFQLISFEVVLTTECDFDPGASFSFTDLSGVQQPLGLTFTRDDGLDLTRLSADIGSEEIFVGPGGHLSVLGANYLACEPETSLVEVVAEVELVSSVPEPSSAALLMTALAGMGMVRRRVR